MENNRTRFKVLLGRIELINIKNYNSVWNKNALEIAVCYYYHSYFQI